MKGAAVPFAIANEGGGTSRCRTTAGGLKVHAVAGTYVVSLGFDLPEADCPGLLGFSIHRIDQRARPGT